MRATASLFEPGELRFVEAVARLAFTNPFGPAHALAVREALGPGPIGAPGESRRRLLARLEPLLLRVRERLGAGVAPSVPELASYREACLFFLHDRYAEQFSRCIEENPTRVDFYGDFADDHARLCDLPGDPPEPPARLFAFAFQIQRALHYIASFLLGGSPPAARLRAKVWESIFTHDRAATCAPCTRAWTRLRP